MKLITFKDIADIGIDPAACVEWVDEALRTKSSALLPHKISLKPPELPDVFYNTMPSILPEIGRAGVKVVTRYPGRRPSLDSEVLLYDLPSGDCLALMDADWITTMRTGAVATHTIMHLAKSGWKSVGFIGLGNTARATLACLTAALPNKELEVGVLAYKDQHASFMQRFEGCPTIRFRVYESVDELVAASDVTVSCITAASGDLCSAETFAPGSLLVPVHTRGFQACDLVFDKVFCDDEGHVEGFGYYPYFKDKLAEVADIVAGSAPGRENDSERIVVYNIGISLHDVFFASRIYDIAGGRGQELDLEKPTEKFWV